MSGHIYKESHFIMKLEEPASHDFSQVMVFTITAMHIATYFPSIS